MTWKNPPKGVKPTAKSLRAMGGEARFKAVQDMANDIADKTDAIIMGMIRDAGGEPADYVAALGLVIRSMSQHMMGTMITEALAHRADAADAKAEVERAVRIMHTLGDELGEVEVEEIPSDGGIVPKDVEAQIQAKIASAGLKVTDVKVVRVGEGFTVMLRGERNR